MCLCVCVSVCLLFSCEQNSSRTDKSIWSRFSLNGCLLHWLKPYWNWWTWDERSRSQWHNIHFLIIVCYLPYRVSPLSYVRSIWNLVCRWDIPLVDMCLNFIQTANIHFKVKVTTQGQRSQTWRCLRSLNASCFSFLHVWHSMYTSLLRKKMTDTDVPAKFTTYFLCLLRTNCFKVSTAECIMGRIGIYCLNPVICFISVTLRLIK